MLKHTTFTRHGLTHEAVRISWDDVAEILGRDHEGTPEDDATLTRALLEAGAPAWAREAAIDECGWYLLGPEAAEPLLDSELEDCTGDHVVVGEETFPVETEEQTAAVARMLARLGLPEHPIFRGAAPDTVKTTSVVIPRA